MMFQNFGINLNMIQLLGALLLIVLILWYFNYVRFFDYWKNKNVPFVKPQFPAGNITKSVLGQESLFISMKNLYNEFKSNGHRHAGIYFFNGPVYFPIDLDIIKSILIKDFEHFTDRGMAVNEISKPLSANLFTLGGLKWKHRRSKLSSMFTTGKIKQNVEVFAKNVQIFIGVIAAKAEQNEEINIKKISAFYTADVITTSILGLEGNTLKNPNSYLANVVEMMFRPTLWTFVKSVLLKGFQNPFNIVKATRSTKITETFFINLVKDTIMFREKTKVERKDLFSSLLKLKESEGLSLNEIIGETFGFVLAGHETSSQTISYCIHELAHNREIQHQLRKEIFDNLGTDYQKFDYDGIIELPYLDKVFNETLRLYPVLGIFNRICDKSYKVPGTNVVIEKGTPVLISILGLHHDPEYFPNPSKFDPGRFDKKDSILPCTFLPFGEGPRFCIGRRHGLFQSKLAIAALVSQFKFLPSSQTPRHIEYDKLSKSLVMAPEKGITVKVYKL